MELNLRIDLSSPRWLRRALLLGVPVAAMAITGAAMGVPKVFVAGETLKAADLNANFSDLETRVAGLEGKAFAPSAFRAHLTKPTTIPSPASAGIAFDVEEFDLGAEYDPVTGVFTASADGVYLVQCSFQMATNPTTASYAAVVAVNGHDNQVMAVDISANANVGATPATVQFVRLAAGDDLQCWVFQNTGSPHALDLTASRNAFGAARLY